MLGQHKYVQHRGEATAKVCMKNSKLDHIGELPNQLICDPINVPGA